MNGVLLFFLLLIVSLGSCMMIYDLPMIQTIITGSGFTVEEAFTTTFIILFIFSLIGSILLHSDE